MISIMVVSRHVAAKFDDRAFLVLSGVLLLPRCYVEHLVFSVQDMMAFCIAFLLRASHRSSLMRVYTS